MYNSFTICSTLFSTEGQKFFKGLVPRIVTVLFNRTKKRAVSFCNQLQNKRFLYIKQVLKISMNLAI